MQIAHGILKTSGLCSFYVRFKCERFMAWSDRFYKSCHRIPGSRCSLVTSDLNNYFYNTITRPDNVNYANIIGVVRRTCRTTANWTSNIRILQIISSWPLGSSFLPRISTFSSDGERFIFFLNSSRCFFFLDSPTCFLKFFFSPNFSLSLLTLEIFCVKIQHNERQNYLFHFDPSCLFIFKPNSKFYVTSTCIKMVKLSEMRWQLHKCSCHSTRGSSREKERWLFVW